jgi:hypothetical protein
MTTTAKGGHIRPQAIDAPCGIAKIRQYPLLAKTGGSGSPYLGGELGNDKLENVAGCAADVRLAPLTRISCGLVHGTISTPTENTIRPTTRMRFWT